MQISMSVDVSKIEAKLKKFKTKQIPFAAAMAFNTTLKNYVKPNAQAEAKKTFKIKTGWALKGIRVIPAKKQNFPHFSAGIGTKDDVIRQNALGEPRVSQISKPNIGNKLAIPTAYARRKFGKRIANPSNWASSLASKKTKTARYFIETENGQDVGLMYAQGRRMWRIYTLKEAVKIPKKFNFERVSHVSFRRHIGSNFRSAMTYALRTAR